MLNAEREHSDFRYPSTEADILTELQDLTHSPGFIYTLAHVVAANTFIKPETASSPHDRPSIKELTLIAGLMATRPVSTTSVPEEEKLAAHVERLNSLLQHLHEVVAQPMSDGSMARAQAILAATAGQSDVLEASPRGPEMVEPIFYVGTGAYDFQYLDLAGEKYRYDSAWWASNIGLSIESLVNAAKQLQRLRELRFRAYLEAKTHEDICRAALATFSFTRSDLSFLTDSEFDAFIDKFAVTPGDVKHCLDSVGADNDLDFKPIMRLCQQEFFMPIGFKLAQAVYESPFVWMRSDEHYNDQAANNRGRVTEEIAARLLVPVFGERVYRNVVVRDGKKTIHEIDVLVLRGNRALAIQAKSKRLIALSRQGDDAQLKKDFSQAVQGAYEQGLVSRSMLFTHEYSLFVDGNPINLPESVEDVYVLCLTLDHFPALHHMTDVFLKKRPSDPYPVTMSVFDLDILATYLPDPLDFLHYIHQRSRWAGRVHGSCEASFLGWYLTRGLALPYEVAHATIGDSLAGLIDEDFPSIRGRNLLLGQIPSIGLQNPPTGTLNNWRRNSELQQFINLLKRSSDPQATDAAFMLLDLPQDVASYFSQKVELEMRHCEQTREISCCSVLLEDKSGFSFVWIPEFPSRLKEVLYTWASASKYKHKADMWLGLGAVLATPDIEVAFNREPWEADAELDELARLLLQPDSQKEKPKRNQPCWCGSGMKYKKCHL